METLTPPIVRRDKRFAFGFIQKSSLGLFISLDLELSRWRIGRGGVPARLRLHFHGETVFCRGETDLTHSPYTIPGCTYAPISITPGPDCRMKDCPCFPLVLPVILGRGPSAAVFYTASIAVFYRAVKGRKTPPPHQTIEP